MKLNNFLKPAIPHLIASAIFLVILFIYFSPTLSGKQMGQSDIIQSIGGLKEANVIQQETGEEVLWSNSSFGGMPVWRGYTKNILTHVHYFITDLIPYPILLGFLSFIGFYILLQAFKVNVWLSFIGASAYTFASFNLISIEAGHLNKVFDMALMAPVLAGIALAYQGRYWLGGAVAALFLSLHIYYGHFQISYYLLLIILFFVIAQFIIALRENNLPLFVKASLVLLLSAIIGITPNVSKLWTTAEYSESTTRGGSELSTQKTEGGGLSKDYALMWSNDITETFTLFIPYFYGGSSHEDVGTSSEIYKSLSKKGFKKEAREFSKSVPLYWGEQPFTAGPVYVGAVICFLFVLGLFLIKGPTKWWILGISLLAIVLSWGKNLEWFTDIFFYYVPLYNKFRSVTMILSIVQVTFALMAFLVLRDIVSGKVKKEEVLFGLKWSVISMGGLALFFALFGTTLFDFTSSNDAQVFQQLPDWLQEAIIAERKSKFRTDSFRSLFFVLATAGLIWAWIKEMFKPKIFYTALAVLVLVDMISVGKRYLNNDDFKFRNNLEKEVFVQNQADATILQDPDPYFRVYNSTQGITSDAITSYHHKSLGGYSAIKLRRYQDFIDSALSKGNESAFNMLNTKYIIAENRQTGQVLAQRNPNALGNAWFIESVKFVKNADEEIGAIQNFDPSNVAIVDERFKDQIAGNTFNKDTSASIQLTTYHPNRLTYTSNASKEQLAVFSEIYYEPGWNAYIDGKPVPHFRANYILRGMVIPAGEHIIEFKFEPKSYYLGEMISLTGSIILLLFLAIIFGREIYLSVKNNPDE